jgi:hypothetical protein
MKVESVEFEDMIICTINLRLFAERGFFFMNIRVICKVRQTQHQNPEFSHTQGEI